MIVGVAVNASIDVKDKTYIIHNLFDELADFFKYKNYGNDINEIIFGIICVAPQFEKFHIIKKPKYVDYKEYVIDDIKIIEEKLFTYSFKVDYELFRGSSEIESRKKIVFELIESLENLNKIPKKIKDFDKDSFKKDIESILLSYI